MSRDEYQEWKDEQTVEEAIRDNWNAAELEREWRDKLASLQPPTGRPTDPAAIKASRKVWRRFDKRQAKASAIGNANQV
jgi:hypothetical protein